MSEAVAAVGAASGSSAAEIRAARPGDARSFLDAFRSVAAEGRFIRTESVRGDVRGYRRQFRRPWDDHAAHVVALDGGRVVGSMSITRDEHPVTHHVATLGMFVIASHRRRGIGAALLEEALRWARTQRVRRIELSVYPDNDAALALYRRYGFVEEGRLVRRSRKADGYRDEILMAVWLGPEPAREAEGDDGGQGR
jgi:RimJ/RimL family protein N-acetyltransferase